MIIATHDPAIAARLPDQWVMRDGLLHTRTHTDCPPDMITTWLLGLLRRRMGRLDNDSHRHRRSCRAAGLPGQFP